MVSLLNMQTDTSASSPTNEVDSVTCSQGRRQFAPLVLLSNNMSLAPKLDATFVPNYLKSKADVETAKKQTQRELMVSL